MKRKVSRPESVDGRSVRRGVQITALAGCLLALTVFNAGCSGAKVSANSQFPVPLVRTYPVRVGWHLSDDLTEYVHAETLEKAGDWSIDLGSAQQPLFASLSEGMFAGYEFIDAVDNADKDFHGLLQPAIQEVQFSTPKQTRSDYYEVWIRYQFKLFNADGTLRGEWPLTAYGKANTQNYGMNTSGPALQAAAIAACRDAMAFFTLQFHTIPTVKDWLEDHDVAVQP